MNHALRVEVQCYAGHRGEETPRRMRMGRRWITAETVLDRWLAPDHRYFKLRGDDGAVYIIRHDGGNDCWELVFYTLDPLPG